MIANGEFGSLGEALATLPKPPQTSSPATTMTNNAKPNGHATPVQQQNQSNQKQQQYQTFNKQHAAADNSLSRKKWCSSATISSLIIAIAAVFFLTLFLKYNSLRPSVDIANKIMICGTPEHAEKGEDSVCVLKADKDAVVDLYKNMINVLDALSVEHVCGASSALADQNDTTVADSTARSSPAISYATVKHALMEINALEATPASNLDLEDRLKVLLRLLYENPSWGVTVTDVDKSFNEAQIVLEHPNLDWQCWMQNVALAVYALAAKIGVFVAVVAAFGALGYAGFRLYVWRKEQLLQEQQDVFELVEKVRRLSSF